MKFTTQFADFFAEPKKEKKKKKKADNGRVRFEIALDAVRDRQLIAYLDKIPNKSEYVRQLIREDIDAL